MVAEQGGSESASVPFWRRGSSLVVVAIAIVWILQLAGSFWARYLEWDESVYFSQVAVGHIPVPLAAQRARMVALLTWPVGLVTDSVVVLRGFLLAVLSAVSLGVARRLDPIGPGVHLGLSLFFLSAVPAFYFTALSPNLWIAMIGLALVAIIAFPLANNRWDLVSIAALGGLAASLRPVDAAYLVGAVGAVMTLTPALRKVGRIAALGGGALAGVAIWLVDALSRFGSFDALLTDAGRQVNTQLGFRVAAYVGVLDGPLTGRDQNGISWIAVLPWMIILAAVAVAVIRRGGGPVSPVVPLAMTVGVAMSIHYVFFTQNMSTRFLLPAWALLSVGAIGAAVADSAGLRRWMVPVVVAFALAQATVFFPLASDEAGRRAEMEVLGTRLAVLADGRPCTVAAEFGAPQIGFASNCVSRRIIPDVGATFEALSAAPDSGPAYIVILGEPDETEALVGAFMPFEVSDGRVWSILEIPAR